MQLGAGGMTDHHLNTSRWHNTQFSFPTPGGSITGALGIMGLSARKQQGSRIMLENGTISRQYHVGIKIYKLGGRIVLGRGRVI